MSWFDLKRRDFPKNEPVLKMKRGLWYRPNDCGYTDNILEAGFYEREDGLDYCFDSNGKNGKYGVLAVPIREAIRNRGLKREDLAEKIENIKRFYSYTHQRSGSSTND